jgi:hypothetical protein
VLGGFSKMKVDGVPYDVVIFRTGLLMLSDEDGLGSDAKRLNRLLDVVPLEKLARKHRFVPFQDVTDAKIVKRTPVRAELELVGGQQLSLVTGWTTPSLTKNSEEVLIELLTDLHNTRPMSQDAAAEAERVRDEKAVVLDAMGNVVVNDTEYDLVILDIGLVLIADPGPFHHGQERLARLVQSLPAYEIVGRNRLIRYEQVLDARITKNIPLAGELDLYPDSRLTIREPTLSQPLTDNSRKVLADALRSVGAGAD